MIIDMLITLMLYIINFERCLSWMQFFTSGITIRNSKFRKFQDSSLHYGDQTIPYTNGTEYNVQSYSLREQRKQFVSFLLFIPISFMYEFKFGIYNITLLRIYNIN